MAGSGDVARRALEACGTYLKPMGFKKRAGATFTCLVSEDVLGFVGLNSASNRPAGPFEINPVVGVRHQPLERAVAELSGRKPHGYVPPSLSKPIGYLMPESRYRAWLFDDQESVDDVAGSLCAAIAEFGTAYLRDHDSLEAIVAGLSAAEHTPGDAIAMRLSVGLALLGDSARARQTVEQELGDLGDRQDLAAEYFRDFARALVSSTYV